MNQLFNIAIFLTICFIIYIIFRSPTQHIMEGFDKGIGGKASDYLTQLTDAVTKKTDILLVSKYRTEYESVILKMDDMIDVLMLEYTLSLNTDKPDIQTFANIATLYQAKSGLNDVMKFVDKK
jgi:hypothetical protein